MYRNSVRVEEAGISAPKITHHQLQSCKGTGCDMMMSLTCSDRTKNRSEAQH